MNLFMRCPGTYDRDSIHIACSAVAIVPLEAYQSEGMLTSSLAKEGWRLAPVFRGGFSYAPVAAEPVCPKCADVLGLEVGNDAT